MTFSEKFTEEEQQQMLIIVSTCMYTEKNIIAFPLLIPATWSCVAPSFLAVTLPICIKNSSWTSMIRRYTIKNFETI